MCVRLSGSWKILFTMVLRICSMNLGRQFDHCKVANLFTQHQRAMQTTSVRCGFLRRYFRGILSYSPKDRRVSPPWKHCTQIGDPVLRAVATEVPIEYIRENQDDLKQLLANMEQVLHDYRLVGIAAPQIGVSLRIFLMEFKEDLRANFSAAEYKARDMSPMPLTTVINPVIKVTNYQKRVFPEGCASICGYNGDVTRYDEILLSGLDENGKPFEKALKGWNARIAQHELDHLNGQLFVDIMKSKSFTCTTWEEVNKHEGQIFIPFFSKEKMF